MGRHPYKNKHLPPRLRMRRKPSGSVLYYYDTGKKPRKEIPLGSDYALALKKYAELEMDGQQRHTAVITFRYVAERYRLEVLPHKPKNTADDYANCFPALLEFFDNPPLPLAKAEPQHVHQFLRWRGKKSQSRANREKAVFSLIWNWARGEGFTDRPNPCQGIKGFKLQKRQTYVYDEVYAAVYKAACAPLRDAMDLAYLTGQRPGDVRRAIETDIRNGMLCFRQSKTDTPVRIQIEGELKGLLERIQARKAAHSVRSLYLICDDRAQPLSKEGLRYRFDMARERAAESNPHLAEQILGFQFRDLRAKAGTDTADSAGLQQAQRQLGHKSVTMTERYVRGRLGDRVKPTK